MNEQIPLGLWTYAQAAEWLGVKSRHFAAIMAAGCIPKVRIGKRAVRVAPADVMAYAEAMKERRP